MYDIQVSVFEEGYVFTSYGDYKYLRDAVVAADSIRRYDTKRPIALFCSDSHASKLEELGLRGVFTEVGNLRPEHQSIVGFKHNTHEYMPFERNLYLDSDIIWCRDADPLWHALRPYPYTITGINSADVFFGSYKGLGFLFDMVLRRRQRTLKRFGLTHLYRVQTGIIYAADRNITGNVNHLAAGYLEKMGETHFKSRLNEQARSLESCEWSLAMAMSKLKLFVYPWLNGYESPQLDFIDNMTEYDPSFRNVKCLYYCNPFVYSIRGIGARWFRVFLIGLFRILPRGRDHIYVTPYLIHFGWFHQKKHFNTYAETRWSEMIAQSVPSPKMELNV